MFGKRKARSHYAGLLAQRAIERNKRDCTPDDVIETVSLGDPSADLIYLDWMLQFLYEIGGGIGGTRETSKLVSLHHEIKHLLPGKHGELDGIHTLEEFAAVLAPYFRGEADLYGGMIGQYRRAALDQSELLFEDEDYLVVCPKTKSAAVFWAVRTNWMFDIFTLRVTDLLGRLEPPSPCLYHANLIAISKKTGEKIIANTGKSFCRDRDGKPASFWRFVNRPDVMHVLGPWLLRQSIEFGTTMPIEFMTREVAGIFVASHDHVAGALPDNMQDRDLHIQAILKDCHNMDDVPEGMIDRDMCAVYVAQDGARLEEVPLRFRDREMCLAAIRTGTQSLRYVPPELLDADFYADAFAENPDIIVEFPREMITRDLLLRAVETGGIVITRALDECLDREICERSIDKKPYLIRSVPERFLDRVLTRRAIAQWGGALQHVKPDLRDRDLCREAVDQDPAAIAYVPAAMRNRDLVLSALARDGKVLAKLPAELKDEETCRVAMRSDLAAARHVPRDILRTLAPEFAADYARMLALAGPPRNIWDSDEAQLADLKARLARL